MNLTMDIIAAIGQDARTNIFMKATVFEAGKYFAKHNRVSLSTDLTTSDIVLHIAREIEKTNGVAMFVGVAKIEGEKPEHSPCYFKHGVQTICTEQNEKLGSILFSKMLKTLGYDVETDLRMNVTAVK